MTLDVRKDDPKVEAEVQEFLRSQVLFRGPDPEIMRHHGLAPLTEMERQAMSRVTDRLTKTVIRNRLQMIANEANEMLSHIASAPGAKWGDLICGVFTAAGDLAIASSNGVLIFAALAQHPIKYILKYWKDEPSVGIRDGDIFMHNDARYGNVHNTDQGCLTPIFYEGKLVAWAGSIIHEGENGAREPGGMPSAAESPYDEGLKISPVKVGENFQFREDLVTYFQNSVRDPKLQLEDMKAKLAACLRIRKRVLEIIEEYGLDAFLVTMRETLEYTADEVRRRLAALPDGKTRVVLFADGTLRENVIAKINCTVEKRGQELIIDFRGSAPQFLNRATNTVLASLKGMIAQVFLNYMWPDLPRNQAVLVPVTFLTDEGSIVDCTPEAPNAQSMMSFFPAFTAVDHCLQKLLFNNLMNGNPAKASDVHASWWNMISGFIYGGYTQHGFYVGNITTDINGMSGGARWNRDGEPSLNPIFAAYVDLGETELLEDELPFVCLSYRRLMADNHGFGKYRGGSGYMQIVTHKDTPLWGWMNTTIGSKFPTVLGLFGGYAAPTQPLCKVRGVNVLELLRNDPALTAYDIVEIMNEKPFPGQYSTHHTGLQLEIVQPGEMYMQAQGGGGGYGDVLERDPDLVMADLQQGRISHWVAQNIYKVAYDPETLVVDREETERLRSEERQARLRRGVPFHEFVAKWLRSEPPRELPYYGSWERDDVVYGGNPDVKMPTDSLQGIFMP
ncbi:MAG: acetone carboxylase subunit alpha [Bacillus thermozeamaize]|uniref:Acetone carboxylase subunit alpha n=1 Tax=Bacillus thermozeamaize TaxID=230954 RepID=A0A1Y3PIX7_9BACI|nr:MAG: acetone carboxylase subunit alpha [Bacillus thermozeamaize]